MQSSSAFRRPRPFAMRTFSPLLHFPLAPVLLGLALLAGACDDEAGTVEKRTIGPQPVSDFQATPGFEEMRLAWVPSDSANVEGTVVFRSDSADFPFLDGGERVPLDADKTISSEALDHQIYDGTAAAIIEGGLTNDQTYYYAAFAYRGDNAYSSGSFAEGTPPGDGVDEGSAAQPEALDLSALPRYSTVGGAGTSFYELNGLTAGTSQELRVIDPSADVTLRIYSDSSFSQEICVSDAAGVTNESCEAPTHQGQVWLAVDDVGGSGASFTLGSGPGLLGPQSIAFAPEIPPFANVLPLADDDISAALSIGFPFRFFGTDYTSVHVASNGFITFESASGPGCCQGGLLPDPFDGVNNVIALAWDDYNPPGGGTIAWELRGSAPNRRFIVSFDSINWCCESGQNRLSGQIILHETTNAIDLLLSNLVPRPLGGSATQGVENQNGTMAYFVPGRVGAVFGASNSAVRISTSP